MKERPILFSGAMVRAILNGTKTQTRRIMKPQPEIAPGIGLVWKGSDFMKHWPTQCPYGVPGDRLWVRETYRFPEWDKIEYRADGTVNHVQDNAEWLREKDIGQKWKPSIFMPRWASRITLEVVNVRVERLQDITEEGAVAEGIQPFPSSPSNIPVMQFHDLWQSINGPDSWEENPWVWVVEFKRITP